MAKLEKETFLSCSYEKRARGRRNRLCVRFKLALVTLVYCLERNPSMNLFVLHLLSLTHSLIKSVTQGPLLHRINSPSSIWNFNYVFLRERISFIIPSVHSFISFLCPLSLYLFAVPRWSMVDDKWSHFSFENAPTPNPSVRSSHDRQTILAPDHPFKGNWMPWF